MALKLGETYIWIEGEPVSLTVATPHEMQAWLFEVCPSLKGQVNIENLETVRDRERYFAKVGVILSSLRLGGGSIE